MMSEIDVRGCCHNNSNGENGICEIYKVRCYQRYCYYKQLQQLKAALNEIEELCKVHTDFCKDNKKNCELCPHEPCEDIIILQKIKEVKEGNNG